MTNEVSVAAWTGRRVLVTGHTGFKGAWLCTWLTRMGAQVTGYSLAPPSEPSLWDLLKLPAVDDRRGDVRDAAGMRNLLQETRPHVVFHLAAQSLVREAFHRPLETFATNLVGTLNLLEAARNVPGIAALVIATTDKCYENRENTKPFREGDALGGSEPYGASKACAELAVNAYRRSYYTEAGALVATVRAGNVIGGGDWGKDRLFGDIARLVLDGAPLRIRHPHAIRPWQHVLDALSAYLCVAQRLMMNEQGFARAWNVGPAAGAGHDVKWVLNQFEGAWRKPLRYAVDPVPGPPEATTLTLDATALRTASGWRAKLDTLASVQWTSAWLNEFSNRRSAFDLCNAQIDTWLALAPGG